jgi:uncharacterized membrane protein YhaH (DUF805 family)
MFKNPFSFEGRIRRSEYALSIIIHAVAVTILGAIVGAAGRDSPVGILGLLLLPMIWFLIAQGAKRSHDTEHSGWMLLVPFWSLILLFMEGTRGVNYYGQDPKLLENQQQQQYLQNGQNYNQNQNYNPNNSGGGYSGGYQGGHNNSGNNNYNPNNNQNNQQQNNQQNNNNYNNNQPYNNPPNQADNGGGEYKGGDLYK